MLAPVVAAALAAAVSTSRIGDGCTAAEVRGAIAQANVRQLGTAGGDPVVLVSLTAACMCGNVNCPWLVVRAGRSAAVLLTTYAFDVGVERSNEPLPRLREHAHDSALVTDEELDAYRGGRYVPVAVYRVRGDTGARKPDAVPVRFAAGASAARLHGSIAAGWYDAYTFDAARGQRLTVNDVTSRATVSLTLFDGVSGHAVDVHPGVPVTLQRSGTFRLSVDGPDERETPYALTLSIR